MVFNSLNPCFKDKSWIRNSPALLQEIVTTNRFMYNAGAHHELACHYFKAHSQELPKGNPYQKLSCSRFLSIWKTVIASTSLARSITKSPRQTATSSWSFYKSSKTMEDRVQVLGGKQKKLCRCTKAEHRGVQWNEAYKYQCLLQFCNGLFT